MSVTPPTWYGWSSNMASVAVTPELLQFRNSMVSDFDCHLSPLLAWNWPAYASFSTKSYTTNQQVTSSSLGGNKAPVDPAAAAIVGACIGSGTYGLTTLLSTLISTDTQATTPTTPSLADIQKVSLDAVLTLGFTMIQRQLAVWEGSTTLAASDPLVGIVVGAVTNSSMAIPATDSTGTISLSASLTAANNAVVAYVHAVSASTAAFSTTQAGIKDQLLAGLVGFMMTPFWTLSHFAAYGDPRIASAGFYDRRYSEIAVADAVYNWLGTISQQLPAPTSQIGTIASTLQTALNTARQTAANTYDNLLASFNTVQSVVASTSSNILGLQATNAQLSRRQSSVEALYAELKLGRRRGGVAAAELLAWSVALVVTLSVAAYLLRRGSDDDGPVVLTLVVGTLLLLTADAIARNVADTGASR